MLVWLLIFGAMNMSHPVRTPIYGLIIVLTVGFSVLTSPLQARVQLDIIAKFRNADVELDVVTVVDSEVEASKSKVALLGHRNALAQLLLLQASGMVVGNRPLVE